MTSIHAYMVILREIYKTIVKRVYLSALSDTVSTADIREEQLQFPV